MVDCDLNVPTIPTSTPYHGSIHEVKRYLEKHRPVGWIEEMGKLEAMEAAGGSYHMIGQESWQIKMRQINGDTVLPRQVCRQSCSLATLFLFQSLLFLNPATLEGSKGDVYFALGALLKAFSANLR